MAAIAHASRVNTTNQTTTNNGYVDATNGDIASGSFTSGKKYLILAMGQIASSATNFTIGIRVVHGTTAFADSEQIWFASADAGSRGTYSWWTVWTAVSSEDINLQISGSANGNTCNLNYAILVAINLSDNVTENTDWFFAERATDDALTTSFLDGASITFTPATASHDWLVLTNAQFSISDAAVSSMTKMVRSGEASSSLPDARTELGINTANQMSLGRVFNLGASSNTFKEQGAESAANVTRLHSRVFALDLNKFRNHSFGYTEADVTASATNYATELQSVSITPDVTGDVWIGAYFGWDVSSTGRNLEYRIQRDNADEPSGQTTANYAFQAGTDNLDELPVLAQAIPSLTAATAYLIDLDASTTGSTGSVGQQRSLWAVTMELPSAQSVVPLLRGEYRRRVG